MDAGFASVSVLILHLFNLGATIYRNAKSSKHEYKDANMNGVIQNGDLTQVLTHTPSMAQIPSANIVPQSLPRLREWTGVRRPFGRTFDLPP